MFRIKQLIKMFLQNLFLPLFYAWYAGKPVRKGTILFADAHHDEIPFSMRRAYEMLTQAAPGDAGSGSSGQRRTEPGDFRNVRHSASGYEIWNCVRDFDRMPYGELVRYLVWFMKQYATAEYVFVCDYFLPVAACRKRPETTVVQLWHSCGLMKKIAYDTDQDIPKGYRGNMFGNYTYLTLSAQVCVPVHARALRMPESAIRATGVSRTDYYFDESWNRRCREAFYVKYPQARGKKIALWAPTFRGNAAMPRLEGLPEIREAAKALEGDWYFLIKAHPHIDAHQKTSNCEIPTEELLPVADLLITDYSSILFDYLLYRKPVVLFAPDLEQYEAGRGFYLNYREIPFPLAQTAGELVRAVEESVKMAVSRTQAAATGRELTGPRMEEKDAVANGKLTSLYTGKDAAAKTGSDGTAGAYKDRIGAADSFREKYVGACDGHATERILKLAGLTGKR